MRACFLALRNLPVLEMLKLEEALFRTSKHSWFITNTFDHNKQEQASAVVLGISGKPQQMMHANKVKDQGVTVIKRFTGGGTVVTDVNTIFASFIAVEEALPHVAPYPAPILEWTASIYAEALAHCGCADFKVQANDYCIGSMKFGGNAQSISGKRWLHHTSLLWDFDPALMNLLKMPPRQPDYRAERSHRDFVRGLSAALPSRATFLDALQKAVSERVQLVPTNIDEARIALSSPHRQTTRVLGDIEL